MPCLKAGKQQKIVIDVDLSIDAPEFEFKLAVKVIAAEGLNKQIINEF